MKASNRSSDQHVVDSLETAAFLVNRQQLKFLKPYLLGSKTVKEAASELGIGLTLMFKKTQRMLVLGLIEVVKTSKRPGRATRHYRAIAQQFFIPSSLYPIELSGLENRQRYLEAFEHSMQRLYRQMEQHLGISTDFTEAGELYLQVSHPNGSPWDYLGPNAPAMLAGWNPLHLEASQAKALQQELHAVMMKYLGQSGSKAYLSGLFLCEMVG